MPGLVSFWSALSTEGRWLLSTVAFQTLGRGLTLPFTVIYLNEVRGFSLDLAGTLMALVAVVGFVATVAAGVLTDRFGARAVLIGSLLCMMAGNTLLGFATSLPAAAVGLALIGVNFGASWPAQNALIATVTSGEQRQQYFGLNFALVNLGIGAGGIIGGLYVDVDVPATFTRIFVADAISGLVPMALLLGPLRHVSTRASAPGDADGGPNPGRPESYLAILRRPAVAWLTGLTFLSVFVGYGQLEAGLPAFVRGVSEVSTDAIGAAFAVNTVVIVVLSAAMVTWIQGRRRTRVMVVMAAIWAVSWLLLGATGLAPGGWAAVGGLLAFMAVFGFGETMLQPTVPATYNDLASDHNRGRYNALSSAAFQGGAILGPIVAGLLLDRGWAAGYIAAMVIGCGLIAALALRLERHLDDRDNGLLSARVPAEEH